MAAEAGNRPLRVFERILLDELGYGPDLSRDSWLPPEEWARSKDRAERGSGGGWLARLRGRSADGD